MQDLRDLKDLTIHDVKAISDEPNSPRTRLVQGASKVLAGLGGPHVAARVVRAAVEGCVTQTTVTHDGKSTYGVCMRHNARDQCHPMDENVAARAVRAAEGLVYQARVFDLGESDSKVAEFNFHTNPSSYPSLSLIQRTR